MGPIEENFDRNHPYPIWGPILGTPVPVSGPLLDRLLRLSRRAQPLLIFCEVEHIFGPP